MKKLIDAIMDLHKLSILTVKDIRPTYFGAYIVRICDAEDWSGSPKATLLIDNDSNEMSVREGWDDDQTEENE